MKSKKLDCEFERVQVHFFYYIEFTHARTHTLIFNPPNVN